MYKWYNSEITTNGMAQQLEYLALRIGMRECKEVTLNWKKLKEQEFPGLSKERAAKERLRRQLVFVIDLIDQS